MSRSLHAVLSELLNDDAARQAHAADPAGFLENAGHTELSDELVAEAIVSFADTAAPGVAEHLAPFVMAHGPVSHTTETGEASGLTAIDGLALIADAPPAGADADHDGEGIDVAATPVPSATDPADLQDPAAALDELDFGTGAEATTPPAGPETVSNVPEAPLNDGFAAPDSALDEPLITEHHPEPIAGHIDEPEEPGAGDDAALE